MKKLRIITLLFLLTISGCKYTTPALLAGQGIASYLDGQQTTKEEVKKETQQKQKLANKTESVDKQIEELDTRLKNLKYEKTSRVSLDKAINELDDLVFKKDKLEKKIRFWYDYDKSKFNSFEKDLAHECREVWQYKHQVSVKNFKSFVKKNQSIVSTLGFSRKYLDAKLMHVSITFEDDTIDNLTFREWLTFILKTKKGKVTLKKIVGFIDPYTGMPITDSGLRIKRPGSPSMRILFKEDMGELYASYYDSGDGNLTTISNYDKLGVGMILGIISGR